MTSYRETMFSCFNSFISEISRIAVLGVPSSESKWISFRATNSPVCRFLPLKTYMIVRRVNGTWLSATDSSIGPLSQLLQLLKRTWVSLIHDWYLLTTSEIADADG